MTFVHKPTTAETLNNRKPELIPERGSLACLFRSHSKEALEATSMRTRLVHTVSQAVKGMAKLQQTFQKSLALKPQKDEINDRRIDAKLSKQKQTKRHAHQPL